MDKPISRYLDAAVLKPETTQQEAKKAIKECIRYKTKTVCVRPCDIKLALELCRGTKTEVSCVLDFPHGGSPSEIKSLMAKNYCEKGVNEIDMVANYGLIRSGEWDRVEKDIKAAADITKKYGVVLKVILETCYLRLDEIKKSTKMVVKGGADYVKSSTGFGTNGASYEAVAAMLEAAEGKIRVKASGGIRDNKTAIEYINMGVHRLGVGYTAVEALVSGSKIQDPESY